MLSRGVVFVLEFKIGADRFEGHAIDQVTDYALDLKNFHEKSHNATLVPVLICSNAIDERSTVTLRRNNVSEVLLTNGDSLGSTIAEVAESVAAPTIDSKAWVDSAYRPTPTIVEAAQLLYGGHSVEEISRSDSGATNLSTTPRAVQEIIAHSRKHGRKSICFLTGVPGAGKTLAGLNLASFHYRDNNSENAVFLSGNGPLVEVLREALARNEVQNFRLKKQSLKKAESLSRAKTFIQNIHHFRDDALSSNLAPAEHVVVFDEAQRAWTVQQLASFMKRKKGIEGFSLSEPEFLVGVMDRRTDWATIVCLIGGGQEINTGEAGIREWFESLKKSFRHWDVYISDKLEQGEYSLDKDLLSEVSITVNRDLHLSVSLRSFRSENVAAFVKSLLDCDTAEASRLSLLVQRSFPIFVTRNLEAAKNWLRLHARGSETLRPRGLVGRPSTKGLRH